jgi:hypothetical protein
MEPEVSEQEETVVSSKFVDKILKEKRLLLQEYRTMMDRGYITLDELRTLVNRTEGQAVLALKSPTVRVPTPGGPSNG